MNVVGGGLTLHVNRTLEPKPLNFPNLPSNQHEVIWLELTHPESVRNSVIETPEKPKFKIGIAHEDADNSKEFYKNLLSTILMGKKYSLEYIPM